MKTHAIKTMAVTLSLILFLSACGTLGTENPHTTTIAPTTEEITTEKNVESTEQTEESVESTEQTEAFSYQIEYGDAIYYKDWRKHYFALFTSPEDMDKLDGVSQEKKEKYDEKWFETHSFAFISLGHGSCCFADVNWVQFEEGCLTVAINFVSKNQEDRYKEKGKDYQLGEGGNHHDEALVNLYAILEFDKNGEEMLGLLEKLIVKVRDWPSRDYLVESEIPLREPEPPVLELEDIPFIAGYRWTEKGKYKYANEYLHGYEKWGDKMVVSSTMSRLRLCFDATDSEELQEKGGFISRRWNSAAIYTMLGLKPSYDCEVKKVSIEDETLRVYADVVHKHWDQLTEAEQAEITSGKVSFLNETDENKYEMYLAIKTEYREEYVELMKTLKKGVLELRDVMSGKTTEMELEFFSLAGEDLGY